MIQGLQMNYFGGRDGSQGPRPCTTPNIDAYSTSFYINLKKFYGLTPALLCGEKKIISNSTCVGKNP